VEGHAVGERDVEVARVAGVEDPEAVAPAVDGEERPRLAVDGDGLTEVLGLPLWVHGRRDARGVHVQRAVDVEAAVRDDEVEVVVVAGKIHGDVDLRLLDDVGAEEAGEEVGAGEAERVVVVPQVARRLHVGVPVRGLRPRGAGVAEPGGEPGEGAAVGLRWVGAAVEVHDGGHAAVLGDGGGHGGVPRQDVAVGEVVLPRHGQRDVVARDDRRARERRGVGALAVHEHRRLRQVAVEFLPAMSEIALASQQHRFCRQVAVVLFVGYVPAFTYPFLVEHADGEVDGHDAALLEAVATDLGHLRQRVHVHLQRPGHLLKQRGRHRRRRHLRRHRNNSSNSDEEHHERSSYAVRHFHHLQP